MFPLIYSLADTPVKIKLAYQINYYKPDLIEITFSRFVLTNRRCSKINNYKCSELF